MIITIPVHLLPTTNRTFDIKSTLVKSNVQFTHLHSILTRLSLRTNTEPPWQRQAVLPKSVQYILGLYGNWAIRVAVCRRQPEVARIPGSLTTTFPFRAPSSSGIAPMTKPGNIHVAPARLTNLTSRCKTG
jgi:hypothetical protein